ncbi:ABC transporter substrate-binding protein [Microbacterium sp. LRZ72]|uniref:ABC transporter substrate-binding protein n=1 Tax=Microbacterium sp. LRZ72 TaxID=2942481 RepID=UPI0029B3DBA9|nr:ABC transporter substrate-binding protein [Microbacterium sp. LRZ72]MDX2375239.1 ABC transporter substrate-binding protein [Microbacterium sp. LRZ72]
MTPTRRLLTWSAAAAATTMVLAACAGDAGSGTPGASDEPIVFGVSGPLTGNQAEYGENWQEGFQIALEEINADGGIDGREVELDFQDSQGEAAQATTIAQRFVSDDSILAVLGDFSSATSMVASPLYQRGGLLQLGITNSHPDFTETGDYVFSPSITQEVEARVVADAAGELGDDIAVFYLNTDWGNTANDVLEDQIAANGDEIVYSTAVEETSTDFRPQLVQARDSGADVAIIYTYYSTAALLAQQAEQVGLDVPYVAVGSNYSQQLLDLAGDAAEGIYVDTSFFPEADDPAVTSFVESYTDEFGYAPNLFAAYAYDGLKQLAWAAENAETLDREGIRNALRDGEAIPSIIYGDTQYNDERRIDDPPFTWLQVQDGAFVETDDLG